MYDILVVDDEPMIREGLKVALEMEGHRALTASDGNEALKIVDESKPQLVITDIIMPESDGIEIICTLKNSNPDIKILAISGGGRISARDHLKIAKQLGATGVLAKPFSTEELICEINKLFEELSYPDIA
jgi:YesN/AraC family two-component response regulator